MASQDNTSNNKRIAKNTIMLYLRMFLAMIVVLATLGVDDYGVYGIVGDVVSMMGSMNTFMFATT